jgi:DNA-binding transcriptional LysR family regulator
MPSAIRDATARHPELQVEMTELGPELALQALRAGEFDVVIGVDTAKGGHISERGIERWTIIRDEVRVALPRNHPLACDETPVALGALHKDAWAGGRRDTAWGDLLVTACRTRGGFDPDIRYRSNDYAVLLTLVAFGLAVTLIPVLAPASRHEGVVIKDIEESNIVRDVFVAVRKGSRRQPNIAAMCDAVERTVATLMI